RDSETRAEALAEACSESCGEPCGEPCAEACAVAFSEGGAVEPDSQTHWRTGCGLGYCASTPRGSGPWQRWPWRTCATRNLLPWGSDVPTQPGGAQVATSRVSTILDGPHPPPHTSLLS